MDGFLDIPCGCPKVLRDVCGTEDEGGDGVRSAVRGEG